MQIRELSHPVTSKKLNESLAKNFGYKLNLQQFTEAQLEDVRNKLRTEMSQFELSESFDAIHESPDYQKTRMFLDVLNQELLERDGQKKSRKKSKLKKTNQRARKKLRLKAICLLLFVNVLMLQEFQQLGSIAQLAVWI